jgi:ABC-type uncharacterized transport system permease subunit
MNQRLAEILLFASIAMNAALLAFLAGVIRKVMNDMQEPAFLQFVRSLYRHSTKSSFMLTILNIPLLGAIPYFYFYGFKNRWIISGLVLWLIAGCIAKIIKVPIYKKINALSNDDVDELMKVRPILNAGNVLQAILNFAAAALMAGAFMN